LRPCTGRFNPGAVKDAIREKRKGKNPAWALPKKAVGWVLEIKGGVSVCILGKIWLFSKNPASTTLKTIVREGDLCSTSRTVMRVS